MNQFQQKKIQSGRSMVEMLGVLAIIGVLSIGGITGYRYAMQKINENKLLRLVDYFMLAITTENSYSESPLDCSSDNFYETEKVNFLCDVYFPAEYCQDSRISYNGHSWNNREWGWEIITSPPADNRIQITLWMENDPDLCKRITETVLNTYKSEIISIFPPVVQGKTWSQTADGVFSSSRIRTLCNMEFYDRNRGISFRMKWPRIVSCIDG